MAMKTLDEVRDEMSEEFDKASWYGRRSVDYFEVGFNSGVAEMKKRNQVLVDCMEMYKDDHRLIAEALQQYKESVGE